VWFGRTHQQQFEEMIVGVGHDGRQAHSGSEARRWKGEEHAHTRTGGDGEDGGRRLSKASGRMAPARRKIMPAAKESSI
jgi:hypothetical protein